MELDGEVTDYSDIEVDDEVVVISDEVVRIIWIDDDGLQVDSEQIDVMPQIVDEVDDEQVEGGQVLEVVEREE